MTHIYIPDVLIPLFSKPRGALSYRVMYGGRGSAKSMTAAQIILIWAACEPLRVLCVRQFQNSLKESFFAELKNALESTPELQPYYTVSATSITSVCGSEFFFKGLERNVQSIKSVANVDVTIAEEAEQIGEDAWRVLLPTVRRRPKAEVWVITNPLEDGSATDVRFVKYKDDRCMAVMCNYRDNQFFPEGLEEERQRDLKMLSESVYRHIWEGEYLLEVEHCVYKRSWFEQRYEDVQGWAWDAVIHSWDTAYKAEQHNDPSACTVWGIKENNAYLLHVLNERMEYPALKQAVIDMHAKHPATKVLIEDKASGQSLIQELRQQTQLPIEAVKPDGDKRTRAVASTQLCADGRIYLPANAEWLRDFEKQMFFFTGDPKLDKAHDDMVDSTSQFINWFKGKDRNEAHKQRLLKALGRT